MPLLLLTTTTTTKGQNFSPLMLLLLLFLRAPITNIWIAHLYLKAILSLSGAAAVAGNKRESERHLSDDDNGDLLINWQKSKLNCNFCCHSELTLVRGVEAPHPRSTTSSNKKVITHKKFSLKKTVM
jgi:hypothetical protein